jgi:hypothetical protein
LANLSYIETEEVRKRKRRTKRRAEKRGRGRETEAGCFLSQTVSRREVTKRKAGGDKGPKKFFFGV